MIWRLQVQLQVENADAVLAEEDREEFLTFVHAVMGELLDIGVMDPDVHGFAAYGSMHVQLDGLADDGDDVIGTGMAAIRCAIQAAGGSTPVWPTHQEAIEEAKCDPEIRRWTLNLSKVEYQPVAERAKALADA